MKKRILIMSVAMALVCVFAVGMTIAYLTSTTETVTNTFTVGNVKITLDEAMVDEMGVPVENADRVTANTYKLLPGHTYTKDPTIHVDESSEDCFIRAKVTITNASAWQALIEKYAGGDLFEVITGFDDGIWWVNSAYTSIDTESDTITYTFVYKNESHTDELGKRIWTLTDGTDLVLFGGIDIPDGLNNEELRTVANTNITIIAEAIQADGFTSEADAWAAFEAQ